jgi:protoporphyrinogen oxidase
MTGIVILGAGIAGISAAYHAKQYGCKTIIYEASNRCGGLLDNFTIDGFRFDKAIHLSFTKDKYVRAIFDQTEYYTHIPNPHNYDNGLWLKHPVQNNLSPLPVNEKVKAVQSFIERPKLKDGANYREFLEAQYGSYISGRYPCRYTEKYWTIPPEKLSTDWIDNRLYSPTLEEVLTGCLTDNTPNTYYAKEMRYPKEGGYKAFLNPMIDLCEIQTGKRAMRINTKFQYVEFSNSEKVYYENLISSIPLPNLIRMMDQVPENIKEAAKDLWATSIALVSVGFNRPDVSKYLWFYIYNTEINPSRAYSPSLKSPKNVPEGCSSLQFEMYFSKYRPLNIGKEHLIEHVVESIKEMRLGSEKDILFTDLRFIPFGNVVFDHGMINKRNTIKQFIISKNIYPIGRFGEWDYLWSDQSLLSGKKVVEEIIQNRKK